MNEKNNEKNNENKNDNKNDNKNSDLKEWELEYSQFGVDSIYQYIQDMAVKYNLSQTLEALPYVCRMHEGQYRKGECKLPYSIHPLTVAAHALALHIIDDVVIATSLCHDICEDCKDENGNRISANDLPIGDEAKAAVALLTKKKRKDFVKKEYYDNIQNNQVAMIVKVLDRCHNISKMATGFSKERINGYIAETEQYVFPLIDIIEKNYPEYKEKMFVIRYHMLAVMESLKRYV
ncbi:MAG: hypothetical protein K6G88_15435 [Lachnospiraceae bacterium]|nr:hypothetical protein [Lachnospiraceae bacterium]